MRFTGHLRAALNPADFPDQSPDVGALLVVEPLSSQPRPGERLMIGRRRATVLKVYANNEFFDPKLEGCIGVAVDEHGLEVEGMLGAFVMQTEVTS